MLTKNHSLFTIRQILFFTARTIQTIESESKNSAGSLKRESLPVKLGQVRIQTWHKTRTATTEKESMNRIKLRNPVPKTGSSK